MTLRDVISADVANVILNTDDFASSVTQWPGGRQAQAATVTAVFLPLDPNVNYERGREEAVGAELQMADSVTVSQSDIWVIDSEVWAVEDLGKPEHGMRFITLVRVDKQLSTKVGGTVL